LALPLSKQWLAKSLLASGIVYTVQLFFIPLFFKIGSRMHDANFLLAPTQALLKIVGYKVSVFQNLLWLNSGSNLIRFSTTWEKVGFLFFFTFILGGVFYILASSSSAKQAIFKIMKFAALTLVYAFIRFVFLIGFWLESGDLTLFWNPLPIFLSMLPLSLFLALILPISGEERNVVQRDSSIEWGYIKKLALGAVAFILCGCFLCGSIVYSDPGELKGGKILIDEKHSAWESITEPLNTESFKGQREVYTYYTLRKWLEVHYSVGINYKVSLNHDILKNYNILILKCLTSPFSNEEVEAVIEFVKQGGGLLLIGDHTDLMGMNTYLNQICGQWDIYFNSDDTFDLETGSLSLFNSTSLAIPSHPIVGHSPSIHFATSCTLKAPLLAEDVITGYALGCEQGSFSHVHFFGNIKADPQDQYGLFLQAVALKFGKGRVAAFTDSTIFSSFSMQMGYNPSFLLGMVDYLNRENNDLNLNLVFLACSIFFFFFGVSAVKEKPLVLTILLILIFSFLGLAIGSKVFSAINNKNYPLPSRNQDYAEVCFDKEHSTYNLAQFLGHPPEVSAQWQFFDAFFVGFQRLGYFPCEKNNLEDCFKGDLVVVINPYQEFALKEKELLKEYVERGGRLLVLDSIRNPNSSSNGILSQFGFRVTPVLQQQENISPGLLALTIAGGYPVEARDGLVHFAIDSYGQGWVGVFVDSAEFSEGTLGNMYLPATEEQLKAFKLQFKIVDIMLREEEARKY
jgi:hypothetical protein